MAKVRNISGEERFVTWVDRVVAVDELVDVPDDVAESFTCQPDVWASESVKKGGK